MLYIFGNYECDTERRTLCLENTPQHLEPQIFYLLTYLIEHRSRVVYHEELYTFLWPNQVVSTGALPSCISAARRAVGDSARAQHTIQTMYGRGYRFVAPVQERSIAKKPLAAIPVTSLPPDVRLAPTSQDDWDRLVRLLPLNSGPRLLFVLMDAPLLRSRLAAHLADVLSATGRSVAHIDLPAPSSHPLQDIFTAAALNPQAQFLFLHGLERSLLSSEHRLGALADLNLHRDQILQQLSCPLVIWTTDATLTDLLRHAPDFAAWQGGVFTLAEPSMAVEAPYRQFLMDHYGKLTLYSVASDAPLAVDLERVFVKLSIVQPQRPDSSAVVSLTEMLGDHPRLVVLGAPGAGKTTLLHFLTLTFARRQSRERLELAEDRLPLFITLRDFGRFLPETANPPDALVPFLKHSLQQHAPYWQVPDHFFEERLARGQCLLLWDGLDEVTDPQQRQRVAQAIAATTRRYPGNRFVITSRPRGYEGAASTLLATLYTPCTIRDFDDADRAAFAHNWYAAVVRDRLGETPAAQVDAQHQAEDLLRAIQADERVRALATNPLLLSVLAMVHQRGVGLPQRRTTLYHECIDMLLGYWDQTKGGAAARALATYGAFPRGEKRTLLEPIALWFHERGEYGLEATAAELAQEIAQQFIDTFGDSIETAHKRARLFLQVTEERAGMLVERAPEHYAFAHLTLQEYLAACALADREDYIAYSLQRLHDPWWREVLLLEVGYLSDLPQVRRARRLTSDLLQAMRQANSWLEEVLKRDVLLAVQALCDTGRVGVDEAVRRSLMDDLFALWHSTPYETQRQDIGQLLAYAMPTVDGERIQEEVFRCLQDRDMAERQKAVAVFRHMSGAAATPLVLKRLLALLGAPDGTIARTAAEALAGLGTAAATPAVLNHLVALLAAPEDSAHIAAAIALRGLGQGAATPSILHSLPALLNAAAPDVRATAVAALVRLDPMASTPNFLNLLLTLLADPAPHVRAAAVTALRELDPATTNLAMIDDVLTLTTDPVPAVRAAAIWTLIQLDATIVTPDIVDSILTLLTDPTPSIRTTAVEALRELGVVAATPALLDRLLALLTDPAPAVQAAAAMALEGLGATAATPRVLDALVSHLTDRTHPGRMDIARLLGTLGPLAVTPDLSDHLQERLLMLEDDPVDAVRIAAMTVQGKFGAVLVPVQELRRLVTLLSDPMEAVRMAAAMALENAASQDVFNDLFPLVSDPIRAATALDTIRTLEVLERLAQFWLHYKDNTETTFFAGEYGRVCDIAYAKLQRLALQHSAMTRRKTPTFIV